MNQDKMMLELWNMLDQMNREADNAAAIVSEANKKLYENIDHSSIFLESERNRQRGALTAYSQAHDTLHRILQDETLRRSRV